MKSYHKRALPSESAVLGGPYPPADLGFQSDRLQVLWKCGDQPWADPGQHFHTDSDELFIVLQGAIEMDVEDERVLIGPGEMCFFPIGVPHAVSTVQTPIQALVIRAPAISDKVYVSQADDQLVSPAI